MSPLPVSWGSEPLFVSCPVKGGSSTAVQIAQRTRLFWLQTTTTGSPDGCAWILTLERVASIGSLRIGSHASEGTHEQSPFGHSYSHPSDVLALRSPLTSSQPGWQV